MAIQRGQKYFVNLNPVQGREQSGELPVLFISSDAINKQPLVVTVVVGTKGANVTRDYPTNVRVSPEDSGLPLETVFMCFQIRSLDPSRFPPNPSGHISGSTLQKIDIALRLCLAL